MKTCAPNARRGFTLVELLVSLTILSLILFSLAQAVGFVSKLWINGVGAVDNFGKARDILTVMDRDIQGMVMRRDLPAFVDGVTPPAPACAFYTNTQGNPGTNTLDTRAVSLVDYVPDYSSNGTPTTFTLYRLNSGNNFTATNVPLIGNGSGPLTGLTYTTGTNNTTGEENIATGVILFGYQFVDGTGAIHTPNPDYASAAGGTYKISASPESSPTTPINYTFDFTAPSSTANSRAVIVSLLVLSNSAVTLVNQTPGMASTLTNDFNVSVTLPSNETYGQYWSVLLNPASGTFGANLPPTVRGGLRVFQRYIPLPLVSTSS